MIFEKLDIQFDIDQLRQDLERYVLPYEPVMMSPVFGGWSLTSASGDYRGGWSPVKYIDASAIPADPTAVKSWLNEMQLESGYKQRIKTELCQGIFSEIIDTLESAGLYPCRARIIRLSSAGKSMWHRDSPEGLYFVRGHIPIITNEGCRLELESGATHFPADGFLYLFKANQMHRVLNTGSTDRFHFVCDIYDTKGITKQHKFTNEDRRRYGLPPK